MHSLNACKSIINLHLYEPPYYDWYALIMHDMCSLYENKIKIKSPDNNHIVKMFVDWF